MATAPNRSRFRTSRYSSAPPTFSTTGNLPAPVMPAPVAQLSASPISSIYAGGQDSGITGGSAGDGGGKDDGGGGFNSGPGAGWSGGPAPDQQGFTLAGLGAGALAGAATLTTAPAFAGKAAQLAYDKTNEFVNGRTNASNKESYENARNSREQGFLSKGYSPEEAKSLAVASLANNNPTYASMIAGQDESTEEGRDNPNAGPQFSGARGGVETIESLTSKSGEKGAAELAGLGPNPNENLGLENGEGKDTNNSNPFSSNEPSDNGPSAVGDEGGSPDGNWAVGGRVTGPGGPTDDAITGNLSNGEYVLSDAQLSHMAQELFGSPDPEMMRDYLDQFSMDKIGQTPNYPGGADGFPDGSMQHEGMESLGYEAGDEGQEGGMSALREINASPQPEGVPEGMQELDETQQKIAQSLPMSASPQELSLLSRSMTSEVIKILGKAFGPNMAYMLQPVANVGANMKNINRPMITDTADRMGGVPGQLPPMGSEALRSITAR